ncbi:hypothetical protein C8J56DRAFT_421087 [Mycena floridula]|nr:hypothetical protein C8J56DRAFT_421087 [Mycena floridula]
MPVRRAAWAQKSILNVLPNELTTEIILMCDCSSKAALCRFSKLFKLLAHRSLYQITNLDETANVISFDAALSANSEYGCWVRSLYISGFCAGQDTVTRILGCMTELRELSVWGEAADWKELSLPGAPQSFALCVLTSPNLMAWMLWRVSRLAKTSEFSSAPVSVCTTSLCQISNLACLLIIIPSTRAQISPCRPLFLLQATRIFLSGRG